LDFAEDRGGGIDQHQTASRFSASSWDRDLQLSPRAVPHHVLYAPDFGSAAAAMS
jgi:hypothetical protein